MQFQRHLRLAVIFLIAGVAAVAVALRDKAIAEQPFIAPTTGVICVWAIYSAVAEVGRRCHAGEDSEVQAEVARSLARIRVRVVERSPEPITPEQLDRFERSQNGSAAPDSAVCQGSLDQMYESVVELGAGGLRASTDELLERPGNPAWGTCF